MARAQSQSLEDLVDIVWSCLGFCKLLRSWKRQQVEEFEQGKNREKLREKIVHREAIRKPAMDNIDQLDNQNANMYDNFRISITSKIKPSQSSEWTEKISYICI